MENLTKENKTVSQDPSFFIFVFCPSDFSNFFQNMQEVQKWKEKSQKLEKVRTHITIFFIHYLFLCQDFEKQCQKNENLKNRVAEFENQEPKVSKHMRKNICCFFSQTLEERLTKWSKLKNQISDDLKETDGIDFTKKDEKEQKNALDFYSSCQTVSEKSFKKMKKINENLDKIVSKIKPLVIPDESQWKKYRTRFQEVCLTWKLFGTE